MDARSTARDVSDRYGPVAMTFHWIVAALIVCAVVAGLLAANADDAHVRALVDLHKSFGLTAMALILMRVAWRMTHRPPAFPAQYARLERNFAHAAHLALYVVIVALPLTGYVHDSAWKLAATHPIVLFGLFEVPRIGAIQNLDPQTKEWIHSTFSAAHTYLGYALYGLLALHLLGVIKHHLVDREPEMARMLPRAWSRRAAR